MTILKNKLSSIVSLLHDYYNVRDEIENRFEASCINLT